MARELGGWLEGPGLPSNDAPGSGLGLPRSGPGSVASVGARFGAYVVDGILANLLAGVPVLVGLVYSPNVRGVVVLAAFLLEEFILVSVTGQTVGMRLFGFRVVRVPGGAPARWPWIALRTVLLGLLIPIFLVDRDLRGLHDRAAGTAVVRVARRA
jgi:uncharacterized RDD family membrane protein YckC